MAIRNIEHFKETTAFHVDQLINLATNLEGSPEVPGVILAVYYLQKSIEEATKLQERKKNGNTPETGAEESTSSEHGTGTPEVRSSVRETPDVGDSE